MKDSLNGWRASRLLAMLSMMMLLPVASESSWAAGSAAWQEDSTTEARRDWGFFTEIALPSDAGPPWFDFVLGPSVFDKARLDLGDLRLYDASDREVPYALRVRHTQSERRPIGVREFNRTPGPDGSRELSLDLGEEPAEHNEIELATAGSEFRRRVQLDGSIDGNEWRTLLERGYLLRFERGKVSLDVRRLGYSPSRFRYLRVRVFPDPEVDKESVEFSEVQVFRSVDVPGEQLKWPMKVGPREPVVGDGGPGSAWIFDLEADNIPCEQVLVHVGDAEFVRNYRIEAGGPAGSNRRFAAVGGGEWSRRPGEPKRPLEARFSEQSASRFRLVVTDHRNQPLEVERAEAVAAARQIVFARTETIRTPLRLYFGNPKALAPNYDFARQLPPRLEPAPIRLTHADRLPNPEYRPPLKPLTERWPWLIYLILTSAALVLAALLVQLARTAIAQHDASQQTVSPTVS